jgi:type I restriction enzyme M protein
MSSWPASGLKTATSGPPPGRKRLPPDGRWRAFSYEELIAGNKVHLDIFWLHDESLEDTANLPDPDVLALEIVEDLQAALEQFSEIAEELEPTDGSD